MEEISLLFICFIIILVYLLTIIYPQNKRIIYVSGLLLITLPFLRKTERENFSNLFNVNSQFIPIEQRLNGSTDIYYAEPTKPKEYIRDSDDMIADNLRGVNIKFETQTIPKMNILLSLYAMQSNDDNARIPGFTVEHGSGAFLDLGTLGKFSFQDPYKNAIRSGFYVLPISWTDMVFFQNNVNDGNKKLNAKIQHISHGTPQSQNIRQYIKSLPDTGYLAIFSQGSIAGIPDIIGPEKYNAASRIVYLLKRENIKDSWKEIRSAKETDLPAQINNVELVFTDNTEQQLQKLTPDTIQNYNSLSAYLALASSKGALSATSAKVIQCPFPLYIPEDPTALVNDHPRNGFIIRGFITNQDNVDIPAVNQLVQEDPTMNFLGVPIQTGLFGLQQQLTGQRWLFGGYVIQDRLKILGRTIIRIGGDKTIPQSVKFLVKSTGFFTLYRIQYQNTETNSNFQELCSINDNTCEKESTIIPVINTTGLTLDLGFQWMKRPISPTCTGGDVSSFSIQISIKVAEVWSEFKNISISQLEIPKLLDLSFDSDGIFENSRVYLTPPNGSNIIPHRINAPLTTIIRNYPKIQWIIESFQMPTDKWNLYDEDVNATSINNRNISSPFIRIRSRSMVVNDAVYYLKVDENGKLGVTLDGGSFGTAWILGKLADSTSGLQMVTLRAIMMDLGMIKDVNTQTSGFGQITRLGKYLSYSLLPTNAGSGNNKTSYAILLRSNVQLSEHPVPWILLNVII